MKISAREISREFLVYVGERKVGRVTMMPSQLDPTKMLYHSATFNLPGNKYMSVEGRHDDVQRRTVLEHAVEDILIDARYGELSDDETITVSIIEKTAV